jgi:two-component system response regulator MprA
VPSRGGAVLVVDDDPGILATVADALDLEGYRVRTATNGREALEVLETTTPSVILLDIRMPVLDGPSFVKRMRERGTTSRILVMTAAENAKRWAEDVGADDFLAKPFDLDDLLAAVARLHRADDA